MRNKSVKFLVSGFWFLCAFAPLRLCVGANYYVDFSGGLDSNPGSLASPFKHSPEDRAATGTAASTVLHGGDFVYLKGGVIYQTPILDLGNGLLICQQTNGAASVDGTGLITDSTVNFSTSNVLAGDLVYIYNAATDGRWIETIGTWGVSNVTAHIIALSNFNAQPYAGNDLTYIVCRPITWTTNAAFGSGPAVFDGLGGSRQFFNFENWTRFSGLTFQNSTNVVGAGCVDTSWGVFNVNDSAEYDGMFIDGCVFSNTYTSVFISAPQKWLVLQNSQIITSGGLGPSAGSYSLIQNNYMTNLVDGVRGAGTFSVIRFNDIHHMVTTCVDHSDGIGPIFSPAAAPGSNKYGWIYANWVEDCTQGIFLEWNNHGCQNWTIAFNAVIGLYGSNGVGTGAAGIFADGAPGTRIFCNSILGTDNTMGWIDNIQIGSKDTSAGSGASWSTNCIVKGNIVYSPDPNQFSAAMAASDVALTNGNFIASGNYYYEPNFPTIALWVKTADAGNVTYAWSAWIALGFDAAFSAFNANPNFVNPNGGLQRSSFNLALTAPISAGFSLPMPIRDLNGMLVPAGTMLNIGAIQTIVAARARIHP